ncbi:hypothetical protein [Cognatilysobacter lacus]|uniref:Uncharacterized protein n=1 Tax=Cognatilysobacter lacus TaxID=1643323 RepID=A0A5D8ZBU2_9GAMM|nr:hypothetical protein [Lysobacter lacus]TZF91523.1 hypothetical protein FW784_01270 [Lysobacter lacus]
MSAIPVGAPVPAVPRGAPLYPRAAFYYLLATVGAVAAFVPSYFSRLQENDAVRHAHGIVGFAWMLLLVTQAFLMRSRKVALHRRLGKAAYVLAPAFVISGLLIVRAMASGATGFEQHFGARLAWVDLLSVSTFGTCVYMAIRDRRQVQLHARWMTCTALLLLPPVFVRLEQALPFIHSFEQAMNVAFGLTELIIVLLLVGDFRQGQRRLPYRALLAVTAAQQVGFVMLDGVPGWAAFAYSLGHLG